MAFKNSLIVYRKEMTEAFRDKRVIYSTIISPLLIIPLLWAVMGHFIVQRTAESNEEVLTIGLIDQSGSDKFSAFLKSDNTLDIIPVINSADAQQQIRDRKLRAVVEIPSQFQSQLDADQNTQVHLYFDKSNEKSTTAEQRIEKSLSDFNEKIVGDRLGRRNLTKDILKPVDLQQENVASSDSMGSWILSAILPYMLVLMGFFGGTTVAFDIAAGEKERGTLETLLVSSATRTEIVIGKFLTIFTVCSIAAISSIAGLVITFQSGLKAFSFIAKGKMSISYPSVALITLMIIPLMLLFAAVLLALSTYARNQKEAQTMFLPLTLLVTMPAALSFVLGAETTLKSSVIPLLNGIYLIKQALQGIFDPTFIAIALASSALYAGLAVVLSLALFNREEVLFRS